MDPDESAELGALLDRVEVAFKRHVNGHSPRQIPANRNDSDLVLTDLKAWRKREPMQFAHLPR